jgi:peptide/nickel transport system substrate-binding protein
MKRRTFIAGVGAAAAMPPLSAPSVAQSSKAKILRFIPVNGLLTLDPTYTTITPTINHAHYVFDTLYSADSKFRAKPQMAEGHTVSDDKLTWDIKLRPSLKFHDGEPVRARDCIASIKRWAIRDAFGASLLKVANEIIAVDDATIRFRLKSPFRLLPDALAHPTASPCCMMPERLASSDPNKPIVEMVGSGPFRFVSSEFLAGERAVYERNAAYIPRQEPADGLAGGKVAYFDRVEWKTANDDATASAALQNGEVDWWENIQFDLAALLARNKGVTVATSDAGMRTYMRFNCGTAPFNNLALRRAVAAAVNVNDYTTALIGDGPDSKNTCFAMYPCFIPGVEELGKEFQTAKKDYKVLADAVKKAGYNGEKIVILSTTDNNILAPMGPVMADMLTKLGMNVDLQSMDLNTMAARRRSQEPVEKGGWSLFEFLTQTPTMANPVAAVVARGLGAAGYPGSYNDPELEADISEWVAAETEKEQFEKLHKVHQRLWDMVPIIPLTSFGAKTAFRSDLTGYIPSAIAIPWNLRRV